MVQCGMQSISSWTIRQISKQLLPHNQHRSTHIFNSVSNLATENLFATMLSFLPIRMHRMMRSFSTMRNLLSNSKLRRGRHPPSSCDDVFYLHGICFWASVGWTTSRHGWACPSEISSPCKKSPSDGAHRDYEIQRHWGRYLFVRGRANVA